MIINHAFVFANGPLRPNPLVNTDMIGIFEELRDRGCDCGCCRAALRQTVEQGTRTIDGCRLSSDVLSTSPEH
jgi:hypothetical protein